MGPLVRVAALAALVAAAPSADPCGFHESAHLQRGVMNWAYPDSLHVGTAVWQAQLSGRLPREDPAAQADLSPEARSRLGYLKTALTLKALEQALAHGRREREATNVAVVLLQPMLWSRYTVAGEATHLEVHVQGPASGDVVLVTESAVLEALLAERLEARDAVRLGLARLYGDPGATRRALDWLAASFPGPGAR